MGIIGEFKAFALRGNVVDMAVGIIIGTAFGKIVSSLVNDVLMPPIGKLLGNADFSNLFVALDDGEYASLAAAQEAGAATLNYGLFINTLIDFVLVALAVFAVIKAMNVAKRRKEEEPPPPKPAEQSSEEKLLTEIRDLLAARA